MEDLDIFLEAIEELTGKRLFYITNVIPSKFPIIKHFNITVYEENKEVYLQLSIPGRTECYDDEKLHKRNLYKSTIKEIIKKEFK